MLDNGGTGATNQSLDLGGGGGGGGGGYFVCANYAVCFAAGAGRGRLCRLRRWRRCRRRLVRRFDSVLLRLREEHVRGQSCRPGDDQLRGAEHDHALHLDEYLGPRPAGDPPRLRRLLPTAAARSRSRVTARRSPDAATCRSCWWRHGLGDELHHLIAAFRRSLHQRDLLGDSNYAGSAVSYPPIVTVLNGTTTSVTAAHPTTQINAADSVTATIHSSDGGGTVSFTQGGVPVRTAAASRSSLPAAPTRRSASSRGLSRAATRSAPTTRATRTGSATRRAPPPRRCRW